nr:cyclin-dependent kinase inhibitor 1C-like [Aegilops tauschii subsp. strangulata]
MSQQNGRAEHVIRTLNDCVRTLLFHSYVPPRFWPDALVTASTSSEPPSHALGSALPALPAPAAPVVVAPFAAPVAAVAAAPVAVPVAAAAPLTGVVTRAWTRTLRPSTRYTSDEYACAASTSAPSPLPTPLAQPFGIRIG